MGLQRYTVWLGTIRQWHWISSALCLVGMLLFAITGITLNHAADIRVTPVVTSIAAQLPESLLENIIPENESAPLPLAWSDWLEQELGISLAGRKPEWSDDEVYVSLPRPGGDAWLAIDLASGELFYEKTSRGWVSYLNDLHKGRNTGVVWFWFIDVFSVACVIFCVTGLVLLYRHAGGRPTTWPMVGLGLIIPLLLAILFIH